MNRILSRPVNFQRRRLLLLVEVERPALDPDFDNIDDDEFSDTIQSVVDSALREVGGDRGRFSITATYAPGSFDTRPVVDSIFDLSHANESIPHKEP